MAALSQSESHLRYPLSTILGSVGSVRVLRALVAERSAQSAPQLAVATGLTPQGVRLVLDTLVRQRLTSTVGAGRIQMYTLNDSHPLASALVTLFHQEVQRWDALLDSIRNVLSKRGPAVSAAWLYGSVARGEDTPTSDLDIAVLVQSQTAGDQFREDLVSLEDEQHLRISVTALTATELAALPEDDPWWRSVVRDGRVLKGAAPEQKRRRLSTKAA